MMKLLAPVLAALMIQAPPSPDSAANRPTWITLGTIGGPISNADRSQPANALLWNDQVVLVDAGDGAVQQLAKARIPLPRVGAVFLSHLHFDHTGGLGAVLGLRYQMGAPGKLVISGPPGTRSLVDGLLASEIAGGKAGFGYPGAPHTDPASKVEVHEVAPGAEINFRGLIVHSVQNTHYSFVPGSAEDRESKSYAYRFDLPGRSILYTGDTGPSPAVDALGKGADLLVSEMIDVPAIAAIVARANPTMPADQKRLILDHFEHQHLSPDQVGAMAAAMGVHEVAVTHLSGVSPTLEQQRAYLAAIHARFPGKVTIATDLERF